MQYCDIMSKLAKNDQVIFVVINKCAVSTYAVWTVILAQTKQEHEKLCMLICA